MKLHNGPRKQNPESEKFRLLVELLMIGARLSEVDARIEARKILWYHRNLVGQSGSLGLASKTIH